jgi:VWFA-related protein
MLKSSRGICSVFCFLFLLPALAQTPQTPTKEEAEVLKIDTDLVVLDALVWQKKTGRVIAGLKAEDFILHEDLAKQQISHFSQDKFPLSVILLLDLSGSMYPTLKSLHLGSLEALQRLKPEDEVAVMTFTYSAELLQDFTKDREIVKNAIAKLVQPDIQRRTGHGTDINEGVFHAALQMNKATHPLSRRVIITITDNYSIASRLAKRRSKDDTYGELLETDSTVCAIIVDSEAAKRARNTTRAIDAALIALNPFAGAAHIALRKALQQNLNIKDYVEKTGGEAVATDRDSLPQALSIFIDHLRGRYSLGYNPTNTKFDGSYRKIKLLVKPEIEKREGGGLAVQTRDGYFARKTVRRFSAPTLASNPSALEPVASKESNAATVAPTSAPVVAVRAINAPKTLLAAEETSAGVQKFSFLVYGATNGRNDGTALQYEHSLLVNAMLETIRQRSQTDYPVRFVLQSGDTVANGRDAQQLNTSFVQLVNKLTSEGDVPYFLVPGDQDVSPADSLEHPERQRGLRNFLGLKGSLLPADDSPRRLAAYPTYAFGHGNTFVLVFDSNIANDEKQYEWVRAQLDGLNRERFKNIIALCHHPAFSSGAFGARTEPVTTTLRTRYLPLFRHHRVKLFITGHERAFEHWAERYHDEGGKAHRLDHLVLGSGGAAVQAYVGEPDTREYLRLFSAEKISLERLAKPAPEPSGNPYHYLLVQVDGEDIKLEVIGVDWGRDFQPYRSNKTRLNEKVN